MVVLNGHFPSYQPHPTGLEFGKIMGTSAFVLGKLMLLGNIFSSG